MQCLEPKFYALFLDHLNLSADTDFQKQFDKALWPTLTGRLAAIFAAKTRDHWAETFAGTNACAAPVLNPEETLAHPMNEARKTWQEVDGVLQAAPAPRFSTAGLWEPKPAPNRGQHSQEILDELVGDRRQISGLTVPSD